MESRDLIYNYQGFIDSTYLGGKNKALITIGAFILDFIRYPNDYDYERTCHLKSDTLELYSH